MSDPQPVLAAAPLLACWLVWLLQARRRPMPQATQTSQSTLRLMHQLNCALYQLRRSTSPAYFKSHAVLAGSLATADLVTQERFFACADGSLHLLILQCVVIVNNDDGSWCCCCYRCCCCRMMRNSCPFLVARSCGLKGRRDTRSIYLTPYTT